MQASTAKESIFFNECGFQAILACADGSGVSSRPAADNCNVVCSFWQENNP
jgi:hypothetical protein